MSEQPSALLRDLIMTSKDGDWGNAAPENGTLPYYIIRGTDFEDVRLGDVSRVPKRYLPEKTVLRRTLAPDDILIETAGGTRDRPTGRTMFVSERVLATFDGPVTCASFARFLRIDPEKAHPEFVFWFLQHLYEAGEMGQHQVQHTGVARFQYTRFSETQLVPLPPPSEQKAIARILGTLDDKIELNRRMNATLEAMARALFRSWFVDFDPVRAKAAGRQPSGIDAQTSALFPDSFGESELGELPKGWNAIPLYDTAQWVNGAAFKTSDFCATGQGLPIVKIAELKDGVGGQTKWSQREATPEKTIDTGDLLYSWSGSPDTSLEAFLWSGGRGLLNQHIFKVITPSTTEKRFVYYLLQNLRPVLVETAKNKQTTGLGHVTVADMKRLLVCVPDKAVLTAFDHLIAPIFDKAFNITLESGTLATLRDTLLPKLLSGDVSIQ
jgi:type I restriction enzyme, S subunit